jgi:DNA replication protein DnaC
VTTLIETRDERTLGRLKAALAKMDLLVLDELGYVPATKIGAELLFDVIATAYERTSLIVTTNLPFEVPGPKCLAPNGSPAPTLDRLTHRCRIIETKGDSHPDHDAKTAPGQQDHPNGPGHPAS